MDKVLYIISVGLYICEGNRCMHT